MLAEPDCHCVISFSLSIKGKKGKRPSTEDQKVTVVLNGVDFITAVHMDYIA